MKKLFILIFATIILLFCRCSENEYFWGYGEVTALKNEVEQWDANISSYYYNDNLVIQINKYSEQGLKRNTLYIYNVPYNVGIINITDSITNSEFYTFLDGDVAGDTYDLIQTNFQNHIEITKIEGDRIWGTFQIAFSKRTDIEIEKDTITFTEGDFFTKIFE